MGHFLSFGYSSVAAAMRAKPDIRIRRFNWYFWPIGDIRYAQTK